MTLTKYEELITHAEEQGLFVLEVILEDGLKGIIDGEIIQIEKTLSEKEKYFQLIHEVSHYHISPEVDLTNQTKPFNRYLEKKVDVYAIKKFFSLEKLCQIAKSICCNSIYEIADEFDVTEGTMKRILEFYRNANGGRLILNPDEDFWI